MRVRAHVPRRMRPSAVEKNRWPIFGRTLALILILSLLCTTLPGALGSEQTAQTTKPGKMTGAKSVEHPSWFKESFLELAADAEEAGEENKHVLLFFEIDGCPYCAKMIDENFVNSSYTEYLQQRFDVIAFSIRGDREVAFNDELSLSEKKLARHLKVRFTPTIIFLNADNEQVLRLNGYRSEKAFKHALDFIDQKAYAHSTLNEFVEQRTASAQYQLRDHPNFQHLTNLSSIPDKPLLVLFEDRSCDTCDQFHERLLNRDDTKEILQNFTAVQLDAMSRYPITDPNGLETTPKAFAEALAITYRPGIVMFDHGKEILRIDGMQYRFHFQQLLRYVGDRKYEQYPDFRAFARADREQISKADQNIHIGESDWQPRPAPQVMD